MSYEVRNTILHGKVLAQDGTLVSASYDDAMELAERFNGQLIKSHIAGKYLIKLPEHINKIEECDCQVGEPEEITTDFVPIATPQVNKDVDAMRNELMRSAKMAIKINDILKSGGNIELNSWVQRKLIRAADYIETVFDYLDYESRYPNEMNEAMAPQAPQAPAAPAATAVQAPKPVLGMVTMIKIGPDGKPQGVPIRVQGGSIAGKQAAGYHVVGESASAGASGAGGIAAGGGNGFANGGPGTLFRNTNNTPPRKKKKTESAMTDAEKGETGPKFTGYWKGTDKGTPGKKMVGGGS